ncbi:hypothetical protein [Paenibacillus chitinolyticus]|uniref:hypothetical protein n=1 Tax=Paenibacillus chitinolyticus TaxID=79263 RepID=UPI0036709A96
MNEQVKLVALIHDQITKLINKECEEYCIDLDKIDLTLFFTAMIKANTIVYNNLTGEQKHALDFTYLVNKLIVQDLMEYGMFSE